MNRQVLVISAAAVTFLAACQPAPLPTSLFFWQVNRIGLDNQADLRGVFLLSNQNGTLGKYCRSPEAYACTDQQGNVWLDEDIWHARTDFPFRVAIACHEMAHLVYWDHDDPHDRLTRRCITRLARSFQDEMSLASVIAGETPACSFDSKIAVAWVWYNRITANLQSEAGEGWFGQRQPLARDWLAAVSWSLFSDPTEGALYMIGPGDGQKMPWLRERIRRWDCAGSDFVEAWK